MKKYLKRNSAVSLQELFLLSYSFILIQIDNRTVQDLVKSLSSITIEFTYAGMSLLTFYSFFVKNDKKSLVIQFSDLLSLPSYPDNLDRHFAAIRFLCFLRIYLDDESRYVSSLFMLIRLHLKSSTHSPQN